ncbi:MAG: enoyl-CoA hydratase/isomerase family protein [Solirubrobacterales bacterium]
MSEQAVLWKKEDGVCVITMNTPASLNAMSNEIVTGLEEAIEDCFDERIRAVVLTGAGRAFCAGGDLAQAIKHGAPDWLRQTPKRLAVVTSCIRRLPKPVIASINGPAFGVGMSIAMACDLRIMSEKASLAQAYTSVGLSPDGAWTLTVPQIVGLAMAMEMVLLDKPIHAEDALRLGLVSMVFPADELPEQTMKLAKKLANGPTQAYASAKALINASMLHALEAQMEAERFRISACGATQDFTEGSDAMFNRRKPAFQGK